MIQYSLLVIVALAIATVLVIRQVARGNAQPIQGPADLEGRTTAIDLQAFRNLMDAEQREFLRRSLPRSEFRRLQRQKLRVGIAYAETVYSNAAILIRLGEALQHAPATLEDGKKIVELALKSRILAMLLVAKMRLSWLSPDFELSPDLLNRDYSHLTEKVGGILRSAVPLKTSHIMAAL